MIVTTITGFGYTRDASGHVVSKNITGTAGTIIIPDNYTYVEVADKHTLDAVPFYEASTAQAFDTNIFVQQLMVAFSADANILPYYAVIKDLASYGNFYGLNILVNGLLAASKITSGEVTILNAVLDNQNIVLSTFTTPP